jgi:hypothetical protein
MKAKVDMEDLEDHKVDMEVEDLEVHRVDMEVEDLEDHRVDMEVVDLEDPKEVHSTVMLFYHQKKSQDQVSCTAHTLTDTFQ